MRNRDWYLVLEEINEEHLFPDRLLYWAVQRRISDDDPPHFDIVLSFHSAEGASWEA